MELLTIIAAVVLAEAVLHGPAIYTQIKTTFELGSKLLTALHELEYSGETALSVGHAELTLSVAERKEPIGFL
jgi:hypothetical protein